MADYYFSGNTEKYGVPAANKIVALKVDVNANPVFTVLGTSTAEVDGTFTVTWSDWDGRVVIGAYDPLNGTNVNCKFHDWIVGTRLSSILDGLSHAWNF